MMFEGISDFIILDKLTIPQVFSGVGSIIAFTGAVITAYLYYQKNTLHRKELIQKEKHNNKNNELSVFIDATKLLAESSDNNSTVIARIAAMYLLYDIASQNPNYVERTLQILNKYVSPLILFIEKETEAGTDDSYADELKIESINEKKRVKEWQYKGDGNEVIISNTLFITRKIVTNCIHKSKLPVDLSNIIIFDLDIEKYFN